MCVISQNITKFLPFPEQISHGVLRHFRGCGGGNIGDTCGGMPARLFQNAALRLFARIDDGQRSNARLFEQAAHGARQRTHARFEDVGDLELRFQLIPRAHAGDKLALAAAGERERDLARDGVDTVEDYVVGGKIERSVFVVKQIEFLHLYLPV